MEIRAAQAGDRQAVRTLVRSCLPPEDTEDLDGLERVLWGDPAGEGLAVLAVRDDDLVGAAFAALQDVSADLPGPVACLKLVAVAEDARRLGVGRAVVSAVGQEASARGASTIQAGGSAPSYWWPGVDRDFTGAVAFFEGLGYAEAREAVNLRVDLATSRNLVTAPAPEDLVPRRLTETEWPDFGAWMRDTWGEAWTAEARAAYDRDPTSCFVASEDGGYLGFAAYDTNRRGWFGPMGSDPSARGRGVGRTLLRACLADYLATGRETCDIAWAGSWDFYADAVGAEAGRRFVLMQRPLGDGAGGVAPSA